MHGKGKYFYQTGAVYEGSWNQGAALTINRKTLNPEPQTLNPKPNPEP
jgi:hypothetical protein